MRSITIIFGETLGSVDVHLSNELFAASAEDRLAALQDAVMTLQLEILSIDVSEVDS